MVAFNLMLNVVILHLLEDVFKKIDMQEEVLDVSHRQQEEYEIFSREVGAEEEIRMIRHDFANQLQTAYGMVDEPENVDMVKEILREMRWNLEGN